MFNPPHPGLILRNDVLPALGFSVTGAAQQLDVNRVTLSRVLNGHASISPEMALRIEAWLGVERGGKLVSGWQNKAHTTYGRLRNVSSMSP